MSGTKTKPERTPQPAKAPPNSREVVMSNGATYFVRNSLHEAYVKTEQAIEAARKNTQGASHPK